MTSPAAVTVFEVEDPESALAPLEELAAAAGTGALVAVRDGLACAVISSDDPFEFAREARTRLAAGQGHARAAASRSASLDQIHRSYHEARCALEATALSNGSAPEVSSYRDLGAFSLLLSLQDDEALRLFCDNVLGPLENGGGEYGEELVRSLEAFIEHNGQWESAARALFCHRHTLRYRVRKIEELTGRDLTPGPGPDRVLARAQGQGAGPVKVGVLGAAGTIAPAIVRDLAESDEVDSLLLLDRDTERMERVAAQHIPANVDSRLSTVDANQGLAAAIEECDVLVNSASYRLNIAVMKACLEASCHYIDLGGLYWLTADQQALNGEFEQAGLLALLGMGSSPGKTNVMARRACRELTGQRQRAGGVDRRDRRGARPHAARGLQRSLRGSNADRRAHDGADRDPRRRAPGGGADVQRRGDRLSRADRPGGGNSHDPLRDAHLRRELRMPQRRVQALAGAGAARAPA